MSSNEGPYRVDRMGVVRGPGGEDYRLGDEDQAGVLCAAMNDAFRAGQRAANEGLVRACEARVADWDRCAQPGAAGEGCADPDDVALARAALAAFRSADKP